LYDAFISYSHAKDKPLATGLQSVIQTLAKPWWRRRASRVFRDDTSLAASAGLGASIECALANSNYFILLASPEAARSKWVEREVEMWLANKGCGRLLIALAAGSLTWVDATGDFSWSSETPLPQMLRGRFDEEPLWVDFTGFRESSLPLGTKNRTFLAAGATLVAAVRGLPKEDLLSEELTQQRRNLRWAQGAVVALTLLAVAAVTAAVIATAQRDRAQRTLDQVTATANRRVRALAERLQRPASDKTNSGPGQVAPTADPEIALAQSRNFIQLASTALTQGDRTKALNAAQEALDNASAALGIAESLASNAPKDIERQSALAEVHDQRGEILIGRHQLTEAEREIRAGLDIWTTLAAVSAGSVSTTRKQALAHRHLAEIALLRSNPQTALAALQTSAAILQPLLGSGTNPELQRDLAVSYEKLGDVLLSAGQKSEAAEWFAKEIPLTERLAADDPDSSKRQDDLAIAYDRLGRVDRDLSRDDAALAALRSSLAVVEPLLTREDRQPNWQRDAAATYEVLGDVFAHRGESNHAVDSFRRALALREQLAASLEDISWQRELERAYRRASEQLLHMGRPADAYETAEQYLLATSLAPDMAPDKPERVAHALGTLCWSALFAKKVSRAKWAGEEATTLVPGLAFVKLNYAHALMYAGDTASARQIYVDGASGDSEVAVAWRKSVREDFAVLTERGLHHPLMVEIENDIKE